MCTVEHISPDEPGDPLQHHCSLNKRLTAISLEQSPYMVVVTCTPGDHNQGGYVVPDSESGCLVEARPGDLPWARLHGLDQETSPGLDYMG